MPARSFRILALTGFMGSGKTTVGRLLAERLGWHFADLDVRIVERAGCGIAELFRRHGEPAFRALETQVLVELVGQALGRSRPTVLALGGGTLTRAENRTCLEAAGAVLIWLDCPVEDLLARCAGIADRPLFTDEASFRALYQQRRPLYEQAAFRVEATGTPETVVGRILALDLFQPVYS